MHRRDLGILRVQLSIQFRLDVTCGVHALRVALHDAQS